MLPSTPENPVTELYQALKRYTPAVRRDRRLSGAAVDSVTVHSPLCGSRLTLDAVIRDGRVKQLGYRVRACSLGQATTAIVAARADDLDAATVRAIGAQLQTVLLGERTRIDWPELEVFALARDVPAHHGSAMLPFRALQELFDRARDPARGPTGTDAGSTTPEE